MTESSGLIGTEFGAGGLLIVDNSRRQRLFKIVSGTNPYTANEVCLKESDGSRPATGAYEITATQKLLHEVNGKDNVPAETIVEATPNPSGVGFYFTQPGQTPGELCEITPNVKRWLISVYTVKSGANVTDVYQRFQNVTTDANGCETLGEPYCVVAPDSCDTTREPEYYCIDGVCWEYYDGLEPDVFDAGPFETAELCDTGCPVTVPTCTEADADNLPNDLTVTITASSGLCEVGCSTGDWSGTALMSRTVGNTWQATDYEDACPGVTGAITLNCIDDVFYLEWGGGSFPAGCAGGSGDCQVAASAGTVSPFSLTFEMPVCCVCDATTPGSTVTVVVTE